MTKPQPAPKKYRVTRAIHFTAQPGAPETVLLVGSIVSAAQLPIYMLGEIASGALEEVA